MNPMDSCSNRPADAQDHAEQLVEDGIEWARRRRGRSVTVVAIELDDFETLRTSLGPAGLAENIANKPKYLPFSKKGKLQ